MLQAITTKLSCVSQAMSEQLHTKASACMESTQQYGGTSAHIWKQPWHLTSMKKLFGDCTSRFVLCFCFSNSAGGCRRSMSLERTCANAANIPGTSFYDATIQKQCKAGSHCCPLMLCTPIRQPRSRKRCIAAIPLSSSFTPEDPFKLLVTHMQCQSTKNWCAFDQITSGVP